MAMHVSHHLANPELNDLQIFSENPSIDQMAKNLTFKDTFPICQFMDFTFTSYVRCWEK